MASEIAFVSVVTPVHNGGNYLKDCIESVLSQTYQNWEYIIQNNCSNDDTFEISRHYAEKDKRIRIYNTEKLLPIVDNWNDALKKISPNSDYCKVIHADDLLYPECIAKMVNIAANNPNVGIVGSYALAGNKIKFDGLQKDNSIISGKELCRLSLKRELHFFGSPTTLLIRSDIVKSRKNFYNRKFIHADTEICYDILRNYDFGFVHQILTYTRIHKGSQTELVSKNNNTNLIEYIGMLKKHGLTYLSTDECKTLIKKNIRRYYISVAKNIFQLQKKEFRTYQTKLLKKMGFSFSIWKLTYYFALVVTEEIFNPKRAISHIIRQLINKYGKNN